MKFYPLTLSFCLFIFVSALTGCKDSMKADIDVGQAYAFATSENARTGAIFMVINNNSDQAHRLINAKSTAAEITEIHQNLIDPDDGKMMMRKIKLLDLPAGKETILEPTGYHIMLIKLTEQLEEKNKISVTLNFENYADIVVPVHIVAPGKIPKFHGDHIH